ncbi:MAG: glycosyltransferase family 1 protein, partial [Alphaproteobacteria bacterium]
STVKISGGLFVTLDLIDTIIGQNELEIHIICPDIPAFRRLTGKAIIHYVPEFLFSYICRAILDFYWLPRKIKHCTPDLVVSLSNLPARTNVCQVFLHDNAFMSEPDISTFHFSGRSRIIHSLRRYIFKHRAKYINRIVTQTELEKVKLERRFKMQLPIVVQAPLLPSHLNAFSQDNSKQTVNTENYRIACISRYFEHKNIEILYEAAQICSLKNLPFQFIITIEEDQGKGAKQILRKISDDNLKNRIYNHGKIKRKGIVGFIQTVDAMILPSLNESYSLNYPEAWFMKKPIFVSDRKFARKVCGKGAIYFEPENAESLINSLNFYFSDISENNKVIRYGQENLKKLATRNDVLQTFLFMENLTVE